MPIQIVRGYAESQKDAVMAEIESIAQKAPPYNARAGKFGRIKCKMTNCGKYGWLSTEGYTKINPATGRRWPPIPPTIAQLMLKVGQQFYPGFRLETVLINFYENSMNNPEKPILGFHQDTSERNKKAPIISLTFGQGTFLVGGKVDAAGKLTAAELKKLDRTLTTNIVLGDGDLLVMHGDERLCFHAAGEVIGDRRINLTGRMVDPISAADKPLIFSMIGMEQNQSLLPVEQAEIEKVMAFRQTTDRKEVSEILLTDRPGFDTLAATYLKSRKYPSVFLYEILENTKKLYPTRHVGNEENTVNEMLEESDYFLASTNGSDKFIQRAIEYFRSTGKEPWIVTIPDVDNDTGESDGLPEPPTQVPPEPERPAKSVGLCVITNISDSGTHGLSSTAWHTPDLTRVYIGRGGRQGIMRSPLHNPYVINEENSREKVIDSFRRESWRKLQIGSGEFYNAIEKIATKLASGKSVELICHCKPLACHGEVVKNAALWMIKEGKVPSTPDEPTNSDNRLHLGMIGLNWIEGLAPRSELEIESLIDNKHREWYLKLKGKPAKNPVIHVRGVGGVIAGPQVGFDGQIQRYLYREKYCDVIVHGKLPDEAPDGWVETDLPFDPTKFNYLFAQWDEVDPEIGALIAAAGTKALVAYYRLPNVGLPNPIPKFDDPQRYAKYGAAVPAGTHVAVVGSREFKGNWARSAIEQFVNALPASCTLVSGGAKGADTFAERAANARGLKTLIHNARWVQKKTRLPDGTIAPGFKPRYFPPDRTVEFSNERANAGPERNKVLIDESHSVYAFSNGEDSPGTQDAISYSSLKDKLAQVFEKEPKKPSPISDDYGSLDIFYYDFE
ncbi:alpha-ketoglutarate-dependent dioxygenase AlkB [Microcoleus sp. D3_18a_C4]|uniref:alpha-ketoglutarate-dependent dioxygenase AlkB n=1 Tax=Microcoleus sp. D3_18a_C4 TaxID=3055332 RepID=UPI002FD3FF03